MVYLDLLFAQNVLMDYLQLSLTSIWRTKPVRKWRLWLAAVLGGIYVLFFFYLNFGFLYTFIGKILFSCVMVGIAFGFSGWQGFIRILSTFYMTGFLMGGCVVAFYWLLQSQVDVLYSFRFLRSMDTVQVSVWSVLAIGYLFSWFFSRRMYGSLMRQKLVMDQLVQVSGEVLNYRFYCTGLVDTGNQLYDPLSRTPVMLVEVKVLPFLPASLVQLVEKGLEENWEVIHQLNDGWANRLRILPYRTVGRADGWLVALRPDKLTLAAGQRRFETSRVWIGLTAVELSPDGSYQAIVHPTMLLYQAS